MLPPGPLGAPWVIQSGRTDRALEKPVTFEASSAKMQGPTIQLPIAFTSARPPLTAQPEDQACQPHGGQEEHFPRGLAPQHRGLGIPNPQRGIHPASPLPTEPLGVSLVIQGRRTGTALRAMTIFEGPGRQNAGAHAPARHCPQLSLHLHSSHSWRIRPAGLLGANLNPRTAPEGPFLRGLAPQHRGLGTPKPQCWMHPAALPYTGR